MISSSNHVEFGSFAYLVVFKEAKTFFLGKGYEPQSSASSDNPCLDLGYSGYDKKKLIQWLFNIAISITAFVCQSACIRNPCKNNAKCQSGFTDKGYHCMCSDGYQGQACDEGNTVYMNR